MTTAERSSILSLIREQLVYQQYQPIVELNTQRIFGYETLMRYRSNLPPDELFRLAAEQRSLYELDTCGIENSLKTDFGGAWDRDGPTVFVNVFPSTLLHDAFDAWLDGLLGRTNARPSVVVFEINEAAGEEALWRTEALQRAIAALRSRGFRIALDDVGDGVANIRKIVEFVPDYIKLSSYFSHRLSFHARKQRLVSLFLEYCGHESRLILEGIEYDSDMECAIRLGVSLGQGYRLGKPGELERCAAG